MTDPHANKPLRAYKSAHARTAGSVSDYLLHLPRVWWLSRTAASALGLSLGVLATYRVALLDSNSFSSLHALGLTTSSSQIVTYYTTVPLLLVIVFAIVAWLDTSAQMSVRTWAASAAVGLVVTLPNVALVLLGTVVGGAPSGNQPSPMWTWRVGLFGFLYLLPALCYYAVAAVHTFLPWLSPNHRFGDEAQGRSWWAQFLAGAIPTGLLAAAAALTALRA